ncbi:ParM/StbA family protein [Hazenella sp. IB182357]|uniref:ParM/StbA family protein n=1 Tax=Polycladospora coralii TaxID=2771432 RepID=A0A926ND16_9BACL|nr:ParM/StbA family protein [Polycladospora coralii]MBD1371208.1 ParM/StbA family protein [Polycladospora coralii]MBS7530150.1 ParM/StbA family protein [Polycladospora coralii]
MLVAVDCGRSYVKVKTEFETFMFPSKVSVWRKRNFKQDLKGDMELSYRNQCWFVGALAEREGEFTRQAMQDTKAVEETLLLTLTAIHQAGGVGKITLVTGLPIGSYTDNEREALRNLLEGTHEVTVNDQVARFTIERVYTTIEGGGAFFSSPRSGLVRIVDVGGKTTNYVTFCDKVFIDRESGTLPIGWETVRESNEREMADLIAGTVSKTWHADDIVVLIGGMAKKLERHMQMHFRHAFAIQDPQMANVKGYFEVGKVMIT